MKHTHAPPKNSSEMASLNCVEEASSFEILQRLKQELCQPETIKLLKNEVEWAENVQLRYEQDIATLKSELEKLTTKFVSNRSQLLPLEAENERLHTELQESEKSLTLKAGEIKSLLCEVYTFKKQNAVLTYQLSEKNKEIKKLKQLNDSLSTQSKKNSKNVSDIITVSVISSVEDQEKEMDIRTEASQELKNKIRELQSEKEERQDRLLETSNFIQKSKTQNHQISLVSKGADQTQYATLQQQTMSKEMDLNELHFSKAEAHHNNILDGDVFGNVETVENLLIQVKPENVKAVAKASRKSRRAPLVDKDIKQGRTKDLISKYQQDLETQQKQLLASQIKTLASQEEESGQRSLKRSFPESNVSSVNKKICLQNLLGKENSVAITTPIILVPKK